MQKFLFSLALAALLLPSFGSAQTRAEFEATTHEGSTTEASVSGYLKIDDIKGESSESSESKGNVEAEWKVEEGESASKPGIEPDEIDFMGEDESGERGGTEDINIGIGEMGEQAQRGEVRVAAGDLDGFSEEDRREFLGTVKAHAEVASEEDLERFAGGVLLQDEAIEEISLNFEKIEVRYRARGRLLGFIPVTFTETVVVDPSADEESRVRVRFPWFGFMVAKEVSRDEIVEEALAEDAHKKWINLDSAGYSEQAETLEVLAEVLLRVHAGKEGDSTGE